MGLGSIFRIFSHDLAIDLGTSYTLIYVSGMGIALFEPSIVAFNRMTNKVEAVGNKAKEMLGRAPGNILAVKPLNDGVIADFDATEKMLECFIKKVCNRRVLVRPRIIICVPSGITQVEKRAVKESALRAKATAVYLVEEPMAAAVGAGLPITEPSGNMIVDIGGGTTEVAVISLAGIVFGQSIRIAGNEMDNAITQYIKRKYNLLIGERTAEQVKIEIGSGYPLEKELTMEIKGRDLVEGVPKTITLSDAEVREALEVPVSAIVDTVKMALEKTPPELAADLVDKGLILTGGCSQLHNLDKRLREEIGIPVSLAEDPMTAVVMGTGKLLENLDLLKRVSIE
ncbi:rod shape-determining protein [bacterium (candidate division B38) B3_B38]|nr:MAG: rod shape-determining protein [bacterium (candidate division B38) B3_B38]